MKNILSKSIFIGLSLMFTSLLLGELVNDFIITPSLTRNIDQEFMEIVNALNDSDNKEDLAVNLEKETRTSINLSPTVPNYTDPSTLISEDFWWYDVWPLRELELKDGSYLIVDFRNAHPYTFQVGLIFRWVLQAMALVLSCWILMLLVRNRLSKLQLMTTQILPNKHYELKNVDPLIELEQMLTAIQQGYTEYEKRHQNTLTEQQALLASVAHEFRTPLARLQFVNEMVIGKTEEEQRKLFEASETALNELESLVRETLNYARLRSEHTQLSLSSVSINNLFHELESIHSFANSNVNLDFSYPEEDILIKADERLVLRALSNLISNAQRYASSKINVTCAIKNNSICIQIMDDGPGISSQNAERIFEPFVRLEPSRSRDSGGFGLGLSIVQSICQKHGFSVEYFPSHQAGWFEIKIPVSAQQP